MRKRLRTLLSKKLVLRIKQDRIEQSGATKISVYICASVPEIHEMYGLKNDSLCLPQT